MMHKIWNIYELSELLKFRSNFYARQIFNASSDYLSKAGAPPQLVKLVYLEEMEVVKKFRLGIDFNSLPETTKDLNFKTIDNSGRSQEQDVDKIYTSYDNLMEIATKYDIKDTQTQDLLDYFKRLLKAAQHELIEFTTNSGFNKKKKNLKKQFERYNRVTV